MTIIKFKKISMMGLTHKKSEVLTELQSLGCVHLLSINPKKVTTLTLPSTSLVDDLKRVLYYLDNAPDKARQKKIKDDFNVDEIVKEALENQNKLTKCTDRYEFLLERIKDLSIWGNFRLPNPGEIGDNRLWFYKIKRKDLKSITGNYVTQEVHRNEVYVYLIVIAKEEPKAQDFPCTRIHTGAVSLDSLVNEVEKLNEIIDELKEQRRYLTRFRYLLSCELADYENRHSFQLAHQQVADHQQFFVLQGWIPEENLIELQTFVEQRNLAMQLETPKPEERPPTLLQSYPWTTGGVELVNFYQTPGYYTFDPSLMIFFSFALFFALILADAGYGFVIALLTLLFWRKLGKLNAGSWLKSLLITISGLSIIYGVMVGSYFGIEPSHHSFLDRLKILNINDYKTMMKLVISIGCLHLIVGNALRGWFARQLSQKLQSAGFIALILGCMVLAIATMHHSPIATFIAWLIIASGLLFILIFASDLPVTSVKSFFKRLIHSLEALSHISALFGDILSYLRLFALGLAGASLAITFNHMAVNVIKSTSHHYGWIAAFAIFIVGQTLNFILCIMSGVIHGLRLNYIEFLKWSIKEDGYPYNPFNLKKMEPSNE
jgi:V/A-type H+/Na+-transporting ATPase subunit I